MTTCPKKIFPSVIGFLLVFVFSVFPIPLYASSNQYYDWGPYYQSYQQVLGFTLSSVENLPALSVPDNLMPAQASGILPDNPLYTIEKVFENTQLTFTFDALQKEQLRLKIAEERLSEAKTLMDQGKTQAASQALYDYNHTLTDISQNLATLAKRTDQPAKELLTKIEETTAAQAVAVSALSLNSSPVAAEDWTEAGSSAREVLDQIAEAKAEPAIPENLSKGLQQLKEQGLLSEEESSKIYSLKNRSEVREELVKLSSAGGLPPSEIAKLDDAVGRYYPEVQNQQLTNLQIVELRSYQTLPQPSEKAMEELKKWQDNPNIPPSNDIKPYLWYNRAQDLAKEVNLTNFSSDQQANLLKYYPEAKENPTYSPPPSPSPTISPSPAVSPSPTPTNTTTADSIAPTGDQTSTPSGVISPTPVPTSPPVPPDPYLQNVEGSLPGQPTYLLKRLGEDLNFAITFDPVKKARIKFEQAERRLAETASLAKDADKTALYESTLKAYQQTMTDAANRVKNLPEGKDAKKTAEQLEAQAGRHEVIFEKGLLPPPTQNPRLLADIIKTTEDAMDKSADVLDRPALPPALVSRLSDLKAQGLILSEETEDLVGSSSREEVRGKIRKLVEQKIFPLADAKKLDEAQSRVSPADYNQLVEVRKVEELQNLRSAQTDLAQTPTLRSTATTLAQKETTLTNSFDSTLIKPEDLAGRENLIKTYERLSSSPRPVNNGQFGPEATPGAEIAPPKPADAVLSTCPEGAVFKQFEGCVWADSGKSLNDYEQYKCDGPRQYYSFAVKKCVAYNETKGWNSEDAQPICPVGYRWSWSTQSCQTSAGGSILPPAPSPLPEPIDDKEREERSKTCPDGSSYKAPEGCVWDDSGKSVYDPAQYRCGRGQYYSFEQQKCVASPKAGEPYPQDATPSCQEEGAFWSWADGKCVQAVFPQEQPQTRTIDYFNPQPTFATPDSPFYVLKQAGERIQQLTAFTPQAREDVNLSHAKERLVEAADALKKNDEQGFKTALTTYTATMQDLMSNLSKEQLTETTKQEIGQRLSKESAEQNLLLEKLSALSPSTQDATINSAISTSILGVDKAADIAGEPAIPAEIKSKIESLPKEMIAEENKKKLLEIDSRVEARIQLSGLTTDGALTKTDTDFLNEDFDKIDPNAKLEIEELKKLEEITTATENKDKLVEKVAKNEDIAQKLQEFEKTFEVGQEVPAEIRPYVRLTRINEVAQTIRPDMVRLDDFQNRKDVLLAVATLQEEFRPTKESFKQVEDFRRKNPGSSLPPDLARIEALSYSLGVRAQAGPCYLPTPPFAPNTPCPAPGAAVPINSYANYVPGSGYSGGTGNTGEPSIDKNGKPLVYGQGPKTERAGICPSGYHWMYDSGGWCMADGGNYSTSYTNYTPSGPTTGGYTPYSSYYNAPGAPPASFGYPVGDNSLGDGCPYGYDSDGRGNCVPNSYPSSSYSYSAPSYYGSAPTYYTTNPPPGTVPGSGPKPTSPGQCPTGYHWMSDSGGWCMADSSTYVPGGGSSPASSYPAGTATSNTPPPGGYNCGSQPYDPVTKKCKDGACPGGFNWDGSKCVAGGYSGGYSGGSSTPWCWSASPPPGGWTCGSGSSWDSSTCSCKPSGSISYPGSGGGYSTNSSYQYGCTPGYYWNGSKCVAGSNEGSGWSDTGARSQSWCQPPSSGCGSNSYWDYGSCYCRSSSTYYGGSGPSPSNQCQGISCGGGAWLDYSTCSCKYSGGSGTSSTGSTITCYPPSAGCPGGWYDYGTCSCKSNSGSGSGSSTGCANVSASSCGSGWYFDSSACTCRQSTNSGSSGSTTSTSGGGSSSGSCPSGYHWMSENGGWCMQDGSGTSTSGSGSTAPSPAPSSNTTSSEPPPNTSTSTEPVPPPSTSTTTESAPPPSEPAQGSTPAPEPPPP